MDVDMDDDDPAVSEQNAHDVSALQYVPIARVVRRARRGRGDLQDLPEMPIDILIEIFSCLHPRDLLHLTRTSKTLRGFLLSRAFSGIWKASFKLVEDVPPCPPYMSLPAYANVAFSTHCHNCLKPGIKSIIWELMVRYCPSCKKLNLVETKAVRINEDLLSQVLAFFSDKSTPRDIYMQFLNHWTRTKRGPLLWHLPQITKVNSTWASLTGVAQKDFLLQHTKEVQRRQQDALFFYKSNRRQGADRLNEIRENRQEAIAAELEKLGWSDDLDIDEIWESFIAHPLVRLSKEVKDHEWPKIRQEMVAFMEKTKQERLDAERRAILQKRLEMNPQCLPGPADFAATPEVRNILDVPSEVQVNEGYLASLLDLRPLMTRWFGNVKTKLIRAFSEGTGLPEHPGNLLLGVALFQCSGCHKLHYYPDVVGHRCFRNSLFAGIAKDEYTTIFLGLNDNKWGAAQLAMSGPATELREVLRKWGKDWTTTTIQQIDEASLRLCWTMPMKPTYRVVGTWRYLLDAPWQHKLNLKVSYSHSWRMASAKESAMAEKLEENCRTLALKAYREQRAWCCSMCFDRHRYRTMSAVQEHLRDSHSIEDSSEEAGHFHVRPDGLPLLPIWTVLFYEKPQVARLPVAEKNFYKEGRTGFLPKSA